MVCRVPPTPLPLCLCHGPCVQTKPKDLDSDIGMELRAKVLAIKQAGVVPAGKATPVTGSAAVAKSVAAAPEVLA